MPADREDETECNTLQTTVFDGPQTETLHTDTKVPKESECPTSFISLTNNAPDLSVVNSSTNVIPGILRNVSPNVVNSSLPVLTNMNTIRPIHHPSNYNIIYRSGSPLTSSHFGGNSLYYGGYYPYPAKPVWPVGYIPGVPMAQPWPVTPAFNQFAFGQYFNNNLRLIPQQTYLRQDKSSNIYQPFQQQSTLPLNSTNVNKFRGAEMDLYLVQFAAYPTVELQQHIHDLRFIEHAAYYSSIRVELPDEKENQRSKLPITGKHVQQIERSTEAYGCVIAPIASTPVKHRDSELSEESDVNNAQNASFDETMVMTRDYLKPDLENIVNINSSKLNDKTNIPTTNLSYNTSLHYNSREDVNELDDEARFLPINLLDNSSSPPKESIEKENRLKKNVCTDNEATFLPGVQEKSLQNNSPRSQMEPPTLINSANSIVNSIENSIFNRNEHSLRNALGPTLANQSNTLMRDAWQSPFQPFNPGHNTQGVNVGTRKHRAFDTYGRSKSLQIGNAATDDVFMESRSLNLTTSNRFSTNASVAPEDRPTPLSTIQTLLMTIPPCNTDNIAHLSGGDEIQERSSVAGDGNSPVTQLTSNEDLLLIEPASVGTKVSQLDAFEAGGSNVTTPTLSMETSPSLDSGEAGSPEPMYVPHPSIVGLTIPNPALKTIKKKKSKKK